MLLVLGYSAMQVLSGPPPAPPFPGDLLFLLCTFAECENFLQLKFCIIGEIPAMVYQCYDHSFIQFFMQITHSL